jgi:hypothetical protein
MTVHNYLDFLAIWCPEQVEDVAVATEITMYCQHDGTRSHYMLISNTFSLVGKCSSIVVKALS